MTYINANAADRFDRTATFASADLLHYRAEESSAYLAG